MIDIFEAWRDLEAGVEINAYAAWVMERLDTLCIVRSDTSAEQEGRGSLVVGEDAPVELLTAAPWQLGLSIEEEIIHDALVGFGLCKVFCCGDVEGFDY